MPVTKENNSKQLALPRLSIQTFHCPILHQITYFIDFDWTQTFISGLNGGVREKEKFWRGEFDLFWPGFLTMQSKHNSLSLHSTYWALQGRILPPMTDNLLRVVPPIRQITPKNKKIQNKKILCQGKTRSLCRGFPGCWVQKWPLFCAQTTHSLCFDLNFVWSKLNLANSGGLNFPKYTPLGPDKHH